MTIDMILKKLNMVMIQCRKYLITLFLLFCTIFQSCDGTKDFDKIKFSDTKNVHDSIVKLNNLFLKLPYPRSGMQKNYGFLDDTLCINDEKISDGTIDTVEVLKNYSLNEKFEIINIIGFLKQHDIEEAGLDSQTQLWFYTYGDTSEGFDYFRFFTVIEDSSDKFKLTLLNTIIENKNNLLLCK